MAQPPSIPPDAVRCISGLIYRVMKNGAGQERPGPADIVRVLYEDLADAESSQTGGGTIAPHTWKLTQVGAGLAEALQIMTVGQQLRVWVPPHLVDRPPQTEETGPTVADITLLGFTRTSPPPSLSRELTSPRRDE